MKFCVELYPDVSMSTIQERLQNIFNQYFGKLLNDNTFAELQSKIEKLNSELSCKIDFYAAGSGIINVNINPPKLEIKNSNITFSEFPNINVRFSKNTENLITLCYTSKSHKYSLNNLKHFLIHM